MSDKFSKEKNEVDMPGAGKAVVRKVLVSEEEEGQKLLNFLQRRLKNMASGVPLPSPLLHRLIRSGQVRVNSARAKSTQSLCAGDEVRIPPLDRVVLVADEGSYEQKAKILEEKGANSQLSTQNIDYTSCFAAKYPGTSVLYETNEYAVVNKPAGLPVHGGTNHEDSLIARFYACTGELPFMPTLTHRIDKATSGIVVVAKTYKFLRVVQDSLKDRLVEKEYLAWVKGEWQGSGWQTLEDYLLKRAEGENAKIQKMASLKSWEEDAKLGGAQHSLCKVQAIKVLPHLPTLSQTISFPSQGEGAATLLRIKLLTGRTHQIRVQLSSRGFPILGDVKYNGPRLPCGMLLHSWYFRLLSEGASPYLFKALPPWSEPFEVNESDIYAI